MAALQLDHLRAFDAFAETLSFTRAAERVHLSQPAVHVQIRKLSESLGQTLYTKEGRTLRLTADGVRVAAFAREIAARCEVLERGTASQTVSLAAGEGACLYLLGPAISTFPGRLDILIRNASDTVSAVRSGEAHFGVAALDVLPDDLHAEELAVVDLVLAMRRDHPLSARDLVEFEDLEGERLVVPPAGRPLRGLLEKMLAGIDWQVGVSAHGWPLTLHFVSLGLGCAVVNGCCRLPDGVVSRPLPGLPKVRYSLLYRTGALHAPQQEALRELLMTVSLTWG